MLENKVYNVICAIEPKSYQTYGAMVSFADIFSALDPLEISKDLLNTLLRKLATDGKISLVCMDGFDSDLILGVRLL